ncbi:3-deoxy-D-manno-octulosonic acid transferase [Pseudoxanthobacter sp. M-2]|uniref:3-deoxy-D-manno-octulosonic acid transferase n=1 Tax=Pseudoxanthobacter sp. M-2 TaxID=3078754 RepID=UPI0038FC81C0
MADPAGPSGGGLTSVWRVVGRLARPLLWGLLAVRTARGKEDRGRRGERFGRPSRPRPEGPLIWVHAASVGEFSAVLPLVEAMVERGIAAVVTTGTVTSARIAADRLPAGALHQFVPLDVAPYISRFLDAWRPSAALFVESEVWPVALAETARRGIPRIVVNARLSARSYRRWRKLPATAQAMFGSVDLVLAQSEADGERFAGLGAATVEVTGNLKVDGPPPPADADELAALAAMVGARPRWVAASTHRGEDEVVVAAHRLIAASRPDVLTVLVPRHPERGGRIAEIVTASGLGVALRSRGEPIRPDTAVYVADTIGELGLFYRLAPVAFVGGSLVERGGQNPIEPARLGAAVLAGPNVANFAALYGDLAGAGALATVTDADSLAAAVGALLDDPAAADAAARNAAAVADRHAGALARTLTRLSPLFDAVAAGGLAKI